MYIKDSAFFQAGVFIQHHGQHLFPKRDLQLLNINYI